MSQPIIEVRNLSKRYQLGAIGATSLREETSRLWDRLRGVPHPDAKEFWALRDVSFDIQPGEVVGVIGRNGAGKSTLLKILSRITEPTGGTAKLRGRVASLLEVGTGFHPELTGRENVFLNGAILGMTRAEVRRKFDEIVAFAEIDQFIDTPVKRYSSGMYVRLAFAVAAHLEPEILIVDEVLAVGDAEFQARCLGKMQNVAQSEGRTVLFVSHQLDAVGRLCHRTLLLNRGRFGQFGPTPEVLATYLNHAGSATDHGLREKQSGILAARVTAPGPKQPALILDIEFTTPTALKKPTLGVAIIASNGQPIFGSNTLIHPWVMQAGTGRHGHARMKVPVLPLWPGRYSVSLWLSDERLPIDYMPGAVSFDAIPDFLPTNPPAPESIGFVHIATDWSLNLTT